MTTQHGPAEMDEIGQEGGRIAMRVGMMFSRIAEMDARRRANKAQQRAQQDASAARAAQAKMQAARRVAQQKLNMVMQPAWSKAVGRNDAAILDAARLAHAYRNELPVAGQALGKLDQHVKANYGVPLHQWQPKVPDMKQDIDEQETKHGQDHPVQAQATVTALDRRDSAEADATQAEATAAKSAREARDAEGQAGQATGRSHLEQTVNPVENRHRQVGSEEFRNALRTTSKAFPGANKASCTRASAPKARKQRGQGRGQGRSRDLDM
ncbi:hypothetical protein FK530_23170 [Tsukamurella conjunctivitidis]|uniref:Uncharacterized protein n=1 Tax=Tsukamurella conjunctivitidis TaxID=2592068 RepID=A0A5C5RSH0_9ACTN|nr:MULTISPECIES: hypothetical protein [Tsukamurella]TWS25528.1 hypothetical protein FK530_23170 [Tsukamurella conjunctivitidis]